MTDDKAKTARLEEQAAAARPILKQVPPTPGASMTNAEITERLHKMVDAHAAMLAKPIAGTLPTIRLTFTPDADGNRMVLTVGAAYEDDDADQTDRYLRGLTTAVRMVSVFAPPSENDTTPYAASVATNAEITERLHKMVDDAHAAMLAKPIAGTLPTIRLTFAPDADGNRMVLTVGTAYEDDDETDR